MKLVRLINMCLKETCSQVPTGKNQFDAFPIQNGLIPGQVLSPSLFNFSFEYVIRKVQEKQEDLELKEHIRCWSMLMVLIHW